MLNQLNVNESFSSQEIVERSVRNELQQEVNFEVVLELGIHLDYRRAVNVTQHLVFNVSLVFSVF